MHKNQRFVQLQTLFFVDIANGTKESEKGG